MGSIYVRAKSKAELNRRLANDETIKVNVFTPIGDEFVNIRSLDHGSTVKIYRNSGVFAAHAYGTWHATKRRVI